MMGRTQRADWIFIVSSTMVWLAGIVTIARDFARAWREGRRLGALNLIGLLTALGGVALRRVARRDLRDEYSFWLRIRDEGRLVTTGVYRHIRHPAYAGDLLFHSGLALALFSPRGLALMLLLVPCYLFRIRLEERMLVEAFGQAYADYMRTSKRLAPLIY
ncbi:MAG: methyltransferase family protein [Candidatus Roseilinea sp.]|uniref:methyltransferase family protein n=1 Tax=Candidatus Roseilinea sp. TaxID=2838777 RepID=UPI00404AF394